MVIGLSPVVIGLSPVVPGLSPVVIGLSPVVPGLSQVVIGLSLVVPGLSPVVIGQGGRVQLLHYYTTKRDPACYADRIVCKFIAKSCLAAFQLTGFNISVY